MFRLINSLSLILLLLSPAFANVTDAEAPGLWFERDARGDTQVNLYFFWSTHCAHCRKALPFVELIVQAYPWVNLKSYQLVG